VGGGCDWVGCVCSLVELVWGSFFLVLFGFVFLGGGDWGWCGFWLGLGGGLVWILMVSFCGG